jgi:hypothetical protein
MKGGLFLATDLLLLCALQIALPANNALSDEPSGLSFVDERGATRSVSAAELAKLTRMSVKVASTDNQSTQYEGVNVSEFLQHLGVVLGKDLRGPRVANYLLFEAADGYRVVIAMVDVDPATTDRVVLLADRKDGAALPEKEGPLEADHSGRQAPRALDSNGKPHQRSSA